MHCLPDHSLDSVEHQHVKLHQLTSRAIKHRAKRIYKIQSKMLISFDERKQSSSKHTEKLSKSLNIDFRCNVWQSTTPKLFNVNI